MCKNNFKIIDKINLKNVKILEKSYIFFFNFKCYLDRDIFEFLKLSCFLFFKWVLIDGPAQNNYSPYQTN